ncbi:glycosyltransferase family 4 protein [Janibacter indicus]|uniref:Glycosyltransferase family 4 protein n=1 Tax=Janibacter indicus TaxID=857417 RepID=A0A7L9IYK2_9MICO|nr:glycosyltransferase family 4 protein [Janibacter indicus]QOK21957.1 glycosyltransferase family 4 protein [Janibacter indicus]
MDDATLKIAVVGPTHPYKGGVASHTTTLAHELEAAGHDVTLVSWSHLYPSFFYPGEQSVPSSGDPDVPPFPRTVRALSWARPDSLVRAGRRLREVDIIIVVHVIPPVVPLHLTLLRAAGVGRTAMTGRGPRSVVIAHNVLPHEPHPGDAALMRTFFRRVDAVVVHSAEQSRLARELDAEHVVVTDLPPHLPGGDPAERPDHRGPARLLALGLVRGYKGIDVLLRAMLRVPDVTLTVAGEIWGDAGDEIRRLAEHRSLRDRVEIHSGYVPAERIAPLLAQHDVLSLTYRSATASQNVLLAHQHALAVLASDVGTFGDQVRDGVDGYLVPPEDEDAIVEVLQRLVDPDEVARIRGGVTPPDLHAPWARYVGTLEALSAPDVLADPTLAAPARRQSRLGRIADRAEDVVALARLARDRRRPRLELSRSDFPAWVRATDVLAHDDEARRARELARDLGLPRGGDELAEWAALGALEVLVGMQDDGGRREALIIDASGSGSPFGRWARAAGYVPVEVELTGARSSMTLLDVDTATLDVVTRLHPDDATAADIDETLTQAGWALRSGGLLCLTLPVGGTGEDVIGGAADLRAVVARAADAGFALVGDVDGDLTARLRHASRVSADPDAAHALVRLTLRRR